MYNAYKVTKLLYLEQYKDLPTVTSANHLNHDNNKIIMM